MPFLDRSADAGDRIRRGLLSAGGDGPWLEQPDEIRLAAELRSDWCRYTDAQGPQHFIRTLLEVPIHGVSAPFLWGVWVSLSQANFQRYLETYDAPDVTDRYFGWLCNRLPEYPDTYAMKTMVQVRSAGQRPVIELEPTDHPLALDWRQGISIARAQELAERVLHR